MLNSFDPNSCEQLELNFRGGFCDSFPEEQQEFEDEVSRVLTQTVECENSFITAITIEEYKLNFTEITKSILI